MPPRIQAQAVKGAITADIKKPQPEEPANIAADSPNSTTKAGAEAGGFSYVSKLNSHQFPDRVILFRPDSFDEQQVFLFFKSAPGFTALQNRPRRIRTDTGKPLQLPRRAGI